MKKKARKALEDKTLKQVYSKRKIEVETVFGNLKGNLTFHRFLLRGLKKVHVEFGPQLPESGGPSAKAATRQPEKRRRRRKTCRFSSPPSF
ncbi:transposase [Bacillus sp. SD088]|nr:transposase [Bacillus sp. SD088]